jgi:hypothetical protein
MTGGQATRQKTFAFAAPDTEQIRLLNRLVENRHKLVTLRFKHMEALDMPISSWSWKLFGAG